MKTIPPPCPEPDIGPRYWRGLDQVAGTPEFQQWLEREFPSGASEFKDPVTRRHFVKIMSASFLLAGMGLTGCRRPREEILPFAKKPENYIHGVPQYYATAMPSRNSAIPLIARANDGRPTKVEGNGQHPESNGGSDRYSQASVLNLYDVDRAQRVAKRGDTASRESGMDFLGQLAKDAASRGGEGLHFLAEQSSSPTRARLQRLLKEKYPKSAWHTFEPVDFDVHRIAASTAFGQPLAPYYKLDRAQVILSLDCDFIGSEPDSWQHVRRYASGRKISKPGDSLNRLYVVESLMTLTGANADHRLRLPSSAVIQLAAQIAAEIFAQVRAGTELSTALNRLGPAPGVNAEWARECAKDLLAHRGKCVVMAGYTQPLAVHLLVHAINTALGNPGQTVDLLPVPEAAAGGLNALSKALNDGSVETLVILGSNPVYTAPAELNWREAQRKAKTVVRLGYYEDETFGVSDWHFPLAHYLESWGDTRTADGTWVPVQPIIEPLFGGLTEIELLARIAGVENASPYDLVRETFRGLQHGGSVEEQWKKFLHDGFLAGSGGKPASVSLDWPAVAAALNNAPAPSAPSRDRIEVVFHRDASVDDGRFNNNGWLQELPDPVTKMVWENVVLMSRKTADDLGLVIVDKENNNLQVPVVRITLDGREVEGPAWIQPGMADHVIGLALGYGRTESGRVGNGSGFNAYRIRTAAAPWIAPGATLAPAGRLHKLVTTQSHWAMEGRPIIREANLEQYRKYPDFASRMKMHAPPGQEDGLLPLYPNPLDIPGSDGRTPREKATHAWGMSIDLNSCVGCSSCMVACQSENNVPIVGKDLVSRSREMHWIRIDRYYAGGVDNPQVLHQPMLCQHCESAPCENVCPVNATVHDEEGLNVMAYNRCVGTRYCSNNCPYKVRRFNYLDYNRRPLDKLVGPFFSSPLISRTDGKWDLLRWWKDPDGSIRPEEEWELLKLAKNPEVTVRMRGVMEKCSFCIQRIEQAKIAQKVKAGASGDVEVPDGTIKTACQQACSADAIVFGNMKDPDSRVSQLKKQDRDYTVLEFLLTKPRTTYLARVRNPNPAMPDYHEEPFSLQEWESRGNTLEQHHGHADAAHGSEAGHETGAKGGH